MTNKFLAVVAFLMAFSCVCVGQSKASDSEDQYKLLATTKTSTMQKELNKTSAKGFRVIVGAPTRGSEMAVFLSRDGTVDEPYRYKLLATTRTSTMQKELNEQAATGYRLIPSTMVAKKSLFGGDEIVMIMELPPKVKKRYVYKLLATNRTRTLQKEVTEAKDEGYKLVGMVSRDEHMVVMEREIDLAP